MAKKWVDFTKREKVIGVLASVFAVFTIGGIANGIGGASGTQSTPTIPATQSSAPVTTTKEITETEAIPFTKKSIDDSTRSSGTSAVTTTGVDGIKTKTYTVTYANGTESKRELKSEVITTPAIDEVTSIGTYVAPVVKKAASTCDPNYSGCVPIASDVDCAGGSGNGPAYVSGPVNVIGRDIYGLDGNNDGVGCE